MKFSFENVTPQALLRRLGSSWLLPLRRATMWEPDGNVLGSAWARLAARARRSPTLVQAIRQRPLPLVQPEQQLGVLFSAKAGCTYAVKWFLKQTNQLDAALSYHPWIHRYRIEVCYRVRDYRPEAVLNPSVRTVKFVRNPYERAVSSYVHAIRTGYDDARIAAFLGRPVHGRVRYSFREFIAYLESMSLNTRHCNPHHKVQVHEAERLGFVPTRIVRVEEAPSVMPRLEREWDLVATDYAKLAYSPHYAKRQTDVELCADRADWPGRSEARIRGFPATPAFYDDSLTDRVRRLYRVDFEAYGYDPEAAPR
jgi:hypothetical protein